MSFHIQLVNDLFILINKSILVFYCYKNFLSIEVFRETGVVQCYLPITFKFLIYYDMYTFSCMFS